mgnify:CR=1 FL=1
MGKEVIAIETDIKASQRNLRTFDLVDLLCELARRISPLVTMPTMARSLQPSLRSMISCAIRVIARCTAVSSMMTALGEDVPIDLLPCSSRRHRTDGTPQKNRCPTASAVETSARVISRATIVAKRYVSLRYLVRA